MENKPLVSVILPVYNGEKYIDEAIRSVLVQTYPRFELIVVDDGSEDSTRQIVERISDERITYLYQHHAGIGTACNHGILSSQGSYLAFIDADDLWLPDKLSRQVEFLKKDPTLDMIFGHVEQFLSPDISAETKRTYTYATEKMPGLNRGTLLIQRASFEKIGFFETKWTLGEFIDWYLRAMEAGLKIEVLADVLLKRRIHNTNIGIEEKKTDRITYKYLRLHSTGDERNHKSQKVFHLLWAS